MNNTNEISNGNGKRRVTIKPEISIGNILTMASLVVAFSLSWGQMNAHICSLAEDVADVQAAEKAHAEDLRVHYMIGSPAEIRLEEIKRLVTEMNAKLDAME